MNTHQVDAYLDDVTVIMLTWKPGVVRNIAVAIVRQMLELGSAWADEVSLCVSKDDSNCIGIAWRLLAKADIVERTSDFRRSEKDASKGRTIFRYTVKSTSRAALFLAWNYSESESPNLGSSTNRPTRREVSAQCEFDLEGIT